MLPFQAKRGTLETLDLSNAPLAFDNFLFSPTILRLFSSFRAFHTLRYINFSHKHFIGRVSRMNQCSISFETQSELSSLSLEDGNFTCEACAIFSKKFSSLLKHVDQTLARNRRSARSRKPGCLNLRKNQLDDDGVFHVCEFLRNCPTCNISTLLPSPQAQCPLIPSSSLYLPPVASSNVSTCQRITSMTRR